MTCNVGQYLLTGDYVDDEAERLVHNCSSHSAVPRETNRRRRGRFLPRNGVKIDLMGGWPPLPEMVISGYQTSRGEVCIDLKLKHGGKVLRKLHTHDCHHNPGGILVSGTHMHFPSVQYPFNRGSSSYAYKVNCQLGTVEDGILKLCELLSISDIHVQGTLGW